MKRPEITTSLPYTSLHLSDRRIFGQPDSYHISYEKSHFSI